MTKKKKKDGRSNNGGFRPGSGRKPKATATLTDPQLQEQKVKYEKLLLEEALPKAYDRLVKAMKDESTPALVRYVFDRVYGRPREADRLTGADENLRRELAIAEAKKRVELLDEQIQLTRLSRKDKERKEGSTMNDREEGRFYPSGGRGVSCCGRYHASLDPSLYPSSPMTKPDILERIRSGPSCPVCGDPSFVADPTLVSIAEGSTSDPSATSSEPFDDLVDSDELDDDEEEGEEDE